MIQIRKNVFETNSSSTHAFTFKPDRYEKDYSIDESLFQMNYVIRPYNRSDITDLSKHSNPWNVCFSTITEKLRYMLSMFYQTNYDELNEGRPLMNRLQKLFPNAIFQLRLEEDQYYLLDDGQYLFEEGDYGDMDKFMQLSDIELKEFFQYGAIYYGDRNYERYYDFVEDLQNKKLVFCYITG